MKEYPQRGIPYYVIYDPGKILSAEKLQAYELAETPYRRIDPRWFARAGLGLTLWSSTYEGWNTEWLRWCGKDGEVIPTGQEKAAAEQRRAEEYKKQVEGADQKARQMAQIAEKLRAQLREHGLEAPENGA